MSLADRFNLEICKIKAALPDVTNQMISDFMKLHNTRLYVVRIWAEQGVLTIEDGAILKTQGPARTKEEMEVVVNALRKLSVFRVGAYFSFQSGSFSSDWDDGLWLLSFVDTTKDLAFLRKKGTETIQPMQMESLYTGWINGNAVIEGYEHDND